MFEKDTAKKITIPKIIFINCDIANGVHEPPPAENNTTNDNTNTIIIGINNTHEKRESFSPKVIIFAFDTRVVDILF